MIQGINQFNYTILLKVLITYEHIKSIILQIHQPIYQDKH